MSSKSSLVLFGLLVGAASLPAGLAAANPLGSAGGINGRDATVVRSVSDTTAAQKKKAAALKKKKLKQQQAAAARAKQAKALEAKQQQQKLAKKKDWYEDDRDRGLDIAAKYAPKTIARVRERQFIAKGDTVGTGGGKKGWQHYMDKYYSR